ncbi:hypothetical protein FALBO_492 [Fusarium albosuccineum]|uniref:Nephrocystin 3-like N-terminal domain-containing protein n=1 Tax=Fusarium albosuccineum TaxID=1237068 RepID=A0A8H4PJ01_9HYPO|nr:hypothetical protein FALBO_492 [Fusarium albosuccineum]
MILTLEGFYGCLDNQLSENLVQGREWLTVELTGCGKSTLAYRVVESLTKTQHSKAIISHAFQSNVSTQHRSLVCLAASIVDQLLPPTNPISESHQNILNKLVTLCHQYKSRPGDCPFEQLWALCVSLLEDERDFILVIDALDECTFNHPNQAYSLLKKISKLLGSTTGRIVIFTRPSPILGVGTTSNPLNHEVRITVEDTLFELEEFCELASAKLSLLPRPLQSRVADHAKANAKGSFQWVTLLFQRTSNICDMEALTRVLDEFPENCWDLYVETWHHQVGELGAYEKGLCHNIMLILLAARRRLTLGEIEDAMGLFPNVAQFIISSFCQPLIQVTDAGLQLSHASVRDFLLDGEFAQSEPDAVLARRCLDFLLKDEYAREDRIGQRLRRNVGLGGSTQDPEKSFYDYAARNWYIHLTALPSPDPILLELANKFLRSPQFAHWAEYSYTDAGDFQAIRSTEIALTVWSKKLPENDRALLHLNEFFERPYTDLSRIYKEKSDDNVLQWLALMHLGFYYFDKGRMTEMTRVRMEVSAGLCELLGRRHPLALRARSDAAYTFLFNGRLLKARQLYEDVVKDQRKVTDDEDPSPFFTLVYQAQAEYLSTDSEAALSTLTTAVAGFLRTSGPESNGFLVAQLWYAIVDTSVGHMDQGIKLLEYVRDKRKEQYGPEDSFGIATQLFVGDLYRRLGKKEQALTNIEPGLKFRRGFWSISHFMTLDTALVLGIAYRDFGVDEMADKLVEELEKHANLEKEENFVRSCQVKHLRALLLFDGGNIDRAIRLLETLLIETSLENNNRALQWIRLDLAYMLRYRRRDGDEHLASSLFDGIVTDQSDDGDEPDPPQWLRVAEKALRLVRRGKGDAAKNLLLDEKLRWAREEDLWMWLGVPPADTGWMKPPRGLGDDAIVAYGILVQSAFFCFCFKQPLMMRKLSKRKLDSDELIRKLPHGDAWHHDIMSYLGSINSSMALLAILRLYNIIRPSKALSTGSVKGDIPLDVMALLVLGLANFSQAFVNFSLGLRQNRWIMGKGLDRITILDALFTVLDWSAAIGKIALI